MDEFEKQNDKTTKPYLLSFPMGNKCMPTSANKNKYIKRARNQDQKEEDMLTVLENSLNVYFHE